MTKNTLWYQTAKRGAMSRLVDLDVEREVLNDLIRQCEAALSNGHAPHSDALATPAKMEGIGPGRHGKYHGRHWTQQPKNKAKLRRILKQAAAVHGRHWHGKPATTRTHRHKGNPNRYADLSTKVLAAMPRDATVQAEALVSALDAQHYPFVRKTAEGKAQTIRTALATLARKGHITRVARGQYRRAG